MSLKELLDKIIEASEELTRQSIDYVKTSSLVSVLNKLVECYKTKCTNEDDKELDDACWYIIYARSGAYSEKTIGILSELYHYTVVLIHKRILTSEENKAPML